MKEEGHRYLASCMRDEKMKYEENESMAMAWFG